MRLSPMLAYLSYALFRLRLPQLVESDFKLFTRSYLLL